MLDEENTSPRAQLRQRLLKMREELIDRLAVQITSGELALLGNVGAALAALDHNTATVPNHTECR